jgi:Ca2+-binding EF-hand superfamily protein
LASLQISFRELLVWLGVYLKGSEEEKLKHIFNAFDQDGNKVLDHSEITNVLMVRMSPEPNAPTTSKRSVERTYRSSRGLPLYT